MHAVTCDLKMVNVNALVVRVFFFICFFSKSISGRVQIELFRILLPQRNKVLAIRLALEFDLQFVVPETVEIADSSAA